MPGSLGWCCWEISEQFQKHVGYSDENLIEDLVARLLSMENLNLVVFGSVSCWNSVGFHPLSAPVFRRRFIHEFLFPSPLTLHSGSQVSSLGCLRVKVVPHSAANQPSVNVFAL